jgi:hypothetical protein
MSSLSFESPEDMPRGMKALYEAQLKKEQEKKQPKPKPPKEKKGKRKSGEKYHSEKVEIGDMKFDSKKEAKRWAALSVREQNGEISDLQTQVKFVLIPAQREPDTVGAKGGVKPGKVIERECSYVADFVYNENGEQVVEDVKGFKQSTAYAVFVVKRKLMLWVHGIRVKEI